MFAGVTLPYALATEGMRKDKTKTRMTDPTPSTTAPMMRPVRDSNTPVSKPLTVVVVGDDD